MTSRNGLGKIIKQQRRAIPLTLQELARAIGVSSSHLGRIERGNRFPSARILNRIAKPLHFGEDELFVLAGYLSPRPFEEVERNIGGATGLLCGCVLYHKSR